MRFRVYHIFMGLSFACNKRIADHAKTVAYSGDTVTLLQAKLDTATRPLKAVLYLSFDDGPEKGTEAVNALALTDSVKINVFIIGKYALKDDSAARLLALYRHNPFIEIGNHSFTHADRHYRSYYRRPDEVMTDFRLNNDTLGLDNKIARLPGRNCWRIRGRNRDDLEDGKAAADSLAVYGYRVFGWDIEWHYDSSGNAVETAAQMLQKIERMINRKSSFTAGHIVILCHDPMLANAGNDSILKSFIKAVKLNGGYRFEHLSNYPNH